MVPGSWSRLWLNAHLIIRLQIYHAVYYNKTQFFIVSQSCWRSLLILSKKYSLKLNWNNDWSLSQWSFFYDSGPRANIFEVCRVIWYCINLRIAKPVFRQYRTAKNSSKLGCQYKNLNGRFQNCCWFRYCLKSIII